VIESNQVRVDHREPAQVAAVAALHAELLPDSPIPRLGSRFMTEFYYPCLVKDGFIQCDAYRRDAQWIGFMAYTNAPFTFMRQAALRNLVTLSRVLMRCLIEDPSRMATLFEVLRLSRLRRRMAEPRVGELLSFGVLPGFTRVKDEKSGLRVPNLLFENAVRALRDDGVEKIVFWVLRSNRPMLLFYQSYGIAFRHAPVAREHLVTSVATDKIVLRGAL
jgi:ribosomal protein S18 acetylase RimI-like enzyme